MVWSEIQGKNEITAKSSCLAGSQEPEIYAVGTIGQENRGIDFTINKVPLITFGIEGLAHRFGD